MKESGKQLAGRFLGLCLGAVFLVSGGAKVADLASFARSFSAYGIITGNVPVLVSAWGLVVIELALGTALVMGWRLRLSLPVAEALILLFIIAVAWAWMKGTAKDCGCFGVILKRSPKQAILEDVLMLTAGFLAWLPVRKAEARPSRSKLVAVICGGLAGLALPFVFGFSPGAVINPPPAGTPLPHVSLVGPYAPDLSKGTYLFFLMETSCNHCRASVPAVNEIARTPGMPPVLAICADSLEDMQQFSSYFALPYPIFAIPSNEFVTLLGSSPSTPRFLLVKDGLIIKHWDGKVPTISELSGQ
jgi:uncharacterized membrane protein YphA (DoxX/SURF4 family)